MSPISHIYNTELFSLFPNPLETRNTHSGSPVTLEQLVLTLIGLFVLSRIDPSSLPVPGGLYKILYPLSK